MMYEPERPTEPAEPVQLNECPICGAEVNLLMRHVATGTVVGCEDCLAFFDPREE